MKQHRAFDIKKDISKTFKRMLTSNHARSNQKRSEADESYMGSTNYGAQSRNKLNPNADDQET